MLPVPMSEPGASFSKGMFSRVTMTSRTDSGARKAPSIREGANCEVTSLKLCTAMSTVLSRSADSSSRIKIPLPPMDASELVRSRSPPVTITFSSTQSPGKALSILRATMAAWARAKREPRVPSITLFFRMYCRFYTGTSG